MIYVDCDGVLADFANGLRKEAGRPLGSCVIDDAEFEDIGIDVRKLPKEFWFGLDRLEEGKKFLDGLIALGYDWRILTNTCSPMCTAGKAAWFYLMLPEYEDRVIICHGKHVLARPGDLLIDDWDLQIERWQRGGGLTYHYQGESADDVIGDVKEILCQL